MFIRPEQKQLYEKMCSRSEALGKIYWGGLVVLADQANPTRYQLAAHSFREMLAKCPELTGNPVIYGEGMKQRLAPVRKAFACLKKVKPFTSETETTDDMESMLSLVDSLDQFFAWETANRPTARKQLGIVLAQLAGAGPALPSDIVEEDISGWMNSDEYFKLVAHHKTTVQHEEFIEHLFIVENVLLRRLQPRPVSDLDEIDRLIREGESDI